MKPFKSALNLEQGGHTSVPRNSFDMGYHTMFTSPAGLLLPTYIQDVQPGDFLKLDVANFTRTMPVNTAAFSRLKEITKFYFVPYRLLWQNFNQFYTGVSDITTSYTPQTGIPSTVPYLTIDNIISILQDGSLDMFGMPRSKFVERLLDLCGYPVSNDSSRPTLDMYLAIKNHNTQTGKPQPIFNMFRLLAYQRIFFDFYRNTDYTANEPTAYNVDNLAGGASPATPQLRRIFEPRYSLWHKDRITSVKPSPLSLMQSNGTVAAVSGEGISDAGYLWCQSQYTCLKSFVADSTAVVNISKLRATMAYDRLARLTMLSPKTYEAQLKAQFGVTPDNCDYCSVRYLGSYDSTINIGEVTASAAGETGTGSKSVLGQLAGKGIASGERNGVIKGNFNEPGIVMGIHHIQPYSEYDSNRLDDFNKKVNRNDYYMPAYDNLGLQPILQGQVYINPTYVNSDINQVCGYQARYLEYKTRVDEVHGQFQSLQSLRQWCMPRSVQISAGFIGEQALYVNPKITDTLFSLIYDGTQPSDPFLCHYRYDASLVRNMSMLGVPTM